MATLADLVATVANQDALYQTELALAEAPVVVPAPAPLPAKTPTERAIDGVAWAVFNTLRGTADTVDGSTWADVRAIVAKGR